jgi:hypothetical protein
LYEEEKRRTNALLFRFFSKLLEEASGGVEAERAEVTVEQVVRELKLLGFSVPDIFLSSHQQCTERGRCLNFAQCVRNKA